MFCKNLLLIQNLYLVNPPDTHFKMQRSSRHFVTSCTLLGHTYMYLGKVCIQAKWPIRPELIPVLIA